MPDVRVFRNDGAELFAEASGSLEYIDPGVVLLYADTAEDVVCSYFEGRLGQPIQGTVECSFADGIDLAAVRPAIAGVDASGFSLEAAPGGDASSARWALDGLDDDPLRIGDSELDAIRRLVEGDGATDGGGGIAGRVPFLGGRGRSLRGLVDGVLLADAEPDWRSRDESGSPGADAQGGGGPAADAESRGGQATDGGRARSDAGGRPTDADDDGPRLDFAARSTYDAARFFAFLVDALADTAATVAVSKAGRVDAIADADVVIHPDGDLEPGRRVAPLPATQDRIDAEREHATRESLRERFADPVDDLGETHSDAVGDPDVDVDVADAVLRRQLARTLDRRSGLTVVDRGRARYRRARIAIVAALLGVVAGVLGAEELRLAGWRVETTVRDLATADLAVVRGTLHDAVGGTGGLAGVAVPVVSALVLAAALLVRRHRQRGDVGGRGPRPSTARADLLRLALAAVIAVSLLALVGSTVLLWTAT